jgi:hypothetical protein
MRPRFEDTPQPLVIALFKNDRPHDRVIMFQILLPCYP